MFGLAGRAESSAATTGNGCEIVANPPRSKQVERLVIIFRTKLAES